MFDGQTMTMYAPGSQQIPHTLIDGAQPASRANEQIVNAYIDSGEFNTSTAPSTRDVNVSIEIFKDHEHEQRKKDTSVGAFEALPTYAAWASVLPGMICVSKTSKTRTYRGFGDSGSACPVLACAFGLSPGVEHEYSFSGVARSQSVKTKGMSQTADDYFTMNRGGIVNILNTSGEQIYNGDLVCWTFKEPENNNWAKFNFTADEPRRIAIARVEPGSYHPNTIGRCMRYASPGQDFDLKIGDE